MSWRKIVFIVVALILLLGGSAALSLLFVSMKPEPRRRLGMDMKRFVKTETVKYSEITSPLSAEGRVVSGNEVRLVSEASGKIEPGAVLLRKGTSFEKGQLLAEIYKDEVELALKARKSRFLTTMTSFLPDMKVDFPERINEFEKFFRRIDMEKDLPEIPAFKNEKLKIFLASRNVFSEYYGIKQDEKRLKRHSLYAPFDGTYTEVISEVGSYVNTGGQIARMIRTDNIEVEVPVKNIQSKWINIGDSVHVISEDEHSVKPGTVIRKSDFIDARTQSRSIFIQVQSSADDELLTGEYEVVEFPGQKIDSAMEIPRKAVFNSNDVFTVVDGKLKKYSINVLKWNETTLIFNGIEEGLKIVVEPLINVKENTPVGILGEEQPETGRPGKGDKKLKPEGKPKSNGESES
ncbi:efflux RND transporter periplasmic adaptor subunit [Bacteroidota bacterium]